MDKKSLNLTPQQIAEYQGTGALILKNILTENEVIRGIDAYESIMKHQAQSTGISEEDYFSVVSQVRDLWKYHGFFHDIIFKSNIPEIAAQLMGKKAARLLHDHIISKPKEESSEVPWHQDYPYWPVDHPGGLSVWLALDDVNADSGALEIIPGSHLEGEEKPVDFIRNPNKSLNDHPRKMRLPVKKGDAVILNSITWHRTGPNTSSPNRRAYISLWIPPESRYAPLHSDWHPVNLNVKVKAGELLNEDWFPVVGERDEATWKQCVPHVLKFHGPEVDDDDLSMFNASRVIKRRLTEWLQLPASTDLYQSLLDSDFRFKLCSELKSRDILKGKLEQGSECLKILAINSIAFGKFKSRNIYNEAYVQFNQIFQS